MIKKQYSSPSMKAYKVKTSAMVCTSPTSVSYGGSNKNTGNNAAECKGYSDEDWDWDW